MDDSGVAAETCAHIALDAPGIDASAVACRSSPKLLAILTPCGAPVWGRTGDPGILNAMMDVRQISFSHRRSVDQDLAAPAQHPIVIVGAGPVGLVAALDLARKGHRSVVIDAKISGKTGQPQPVKNEKFYLLDKDLESILSEAGLEPIEGQTLMNSLGLSVLYPDRFDEFNRNALRAIKGHIKYAGTTDTSGKAEMGGIEPNSYYLFAVTKSGRGFAIWSSPVSIIPGQNALNLTPQRLTEMEMAPGE